MEIMAHKFIIQNGEIKHAAVEFHRELAKNDILNIEGGGMMEFDPTINAVYMFGESKEFGKFSRATAYDCTERGHFGWRFKDWSVWYSPELDFETANQKGWERIG